MERQAEPARPLEELFADETAALADAAVDEVIARAGGAREAVRALLIQLGETDRAASLGYRRLQQPSPPR